MATEVYARIMRFDHYYATQGLLRERIGRNMYIMAFVDSKTLFDVVAKNGSIVKNDS